MSNSYLATCINFPIERDVLLDIVEKAKDWALMHGVGLRSKANFNPDVMQIAPFTLIPTAFPRQEFEKAVRLQTILNELMHWVAHDSDFLCETLSSTIKGDEFTANLFQIYETILAENDQQPLSLGLLRSDLMLESICAEDCSCPRSYCCWKQVEINTIASGFGHLGPISKEIQSYILQELGYADKLVNLPPNNALAGLCDAMVEAWNLQANREAVILFIVEDVTYNICDQRFHEFYIRREYPHVKVIRKTLTEIHKFGKLGPKKELIVNDVVASVVYFRAAYDPQHFPSKNEWDARLLIEKSYAIKCPSIQYQLAGTKKVQQALAKPGILGRFIKDATQIKAISDIFTGIYSLDDNEEGRKGLEMALKDPERYVLKPQREGGGNNTYGMEIVDALKNMSALERSGYILMERIFPPISKGYVVRPGGPSPPELLDLISELGIFGAIIGDKSKILYNKQCGHMLRTKLSSVNEGGVAAGLGALDSPYLIDD
ncbi:glutathione synthetase-like isoform X1 [Bradysia coprophila]|uniref:glutathione synthetase-like isoform X1 n=1 Tax=Bradysia coprophila TaxID=38358 RepID=UPI00187D992A|nr:glutathione synthetase-like isoform X1 [Bradysia coprophila]